MNATVGQKLPSTVARKYTTMLMIFRAFKRNCAFAPFSQAIR